MSIILKGIDLPKEGDIKYLTIDDYGQVFEQVTDVEFEKRGQAIQIERPHGRLIDGDELLGFFMNHAWDWATVDGITTTTALKQVISDVKNAPTVIEAEE